MPRICGNGMTVNSFAADFHRFVLSMDIRLASHPWRRGPCPHIDLAVVLVSDHQTDTVRLAREEKLG